MIHGMSTNYIFLIVISHIIRFCFIYSYIELAGLGVYVSSGAGARPAFWLKILDPKRLVNLLFVPLVAHEFASSSATRGDRGSTHRRADSP